MLFFSLAAAGYFILVLKTAGSFWGACLLSGAILTAGGLAAVLNGKGVDR